MVESSIARLAGGGVRLQLRPLREAESSGEEARHRLARLRTRHDDTDMARRNAGSSSAFPAPSTAQRVGPSLTRTVRWVTA